MGTRKGIAIKAAILLTMIMVLGQAVGKTETVAIGQWEMMIDSNYDVHVQDVNEQAITMIVDVNYTLPNPCYRIEPTVQPLRCPNCYEVYLYEVPPKPDLVCTEVLHQVPHVRVAVGPLSKVTSRVYVRIHPVTPKVSIEENAGGLKCFEMEENYVAKSRLLQHCDINPECNAERVSQELSELAKRLKALCNTTPPKIVLPKVEKEMPRIIIPKTDVEKSAVELHIPHVQMDVNEIIGIVARTVPKGEVRKVEVKERNGRIIHEVEVIEKKRLLGIVPVDIPEKVVVDAKEKKVVSVNRPWWASLLGPLLI